MKYKTGLLLSPRPPELAFKSYLLPQLLPPVPATFGHQNLYPVRGWGMLANDRIGDCTVAGAMHACMLWRALANDRIQFTNRDAQLDYSAITGYRPGQHDTDTGADMVTVAKYWQEIGFRDSHANRHKIAAYLDIDTANRTNIDTSCWLFNATGLGISVGEEEDWAFRKQKPWDNPNSEAVGYHYVPFIGKDDQYRYVVTWGGLQPVTEGWFEAKVNETVAMLSTESLVDNKSAEGFDVERLTEDLELLG